jgi:hypothetical protein
MNLPSLKKNVHCDDKRTLAALKENILVCFNELKEEDYDNKNILKKLNDSIAEYNECKLSL